MRGHLPDCLRIAVWITLVFLGSIASAHPLDHWNPRTTPTAQDLHDVAYGNGVFVAVGKAGTILHSSDGISWLPAASGTANNLDAVVFGGGLFVAVGDQG